MAISTALYRASVRILKSVSPVFAGGRSKVARGIRGRRGARRAIVEWSRGHRDPRRPLLWFHAPSVGEGLQAKAVMDALRAAQPAAQMVFTHFSPSAEDLARRMPADVATYLPWDVVADVGAVLDAARPDAVVFTKTEVWPVLAAAARSRGAATALVAATLPPGAGRLKWPARAVLRPAFTGLDHRAALSADDADRFRELGARPDCTVVTGDPAIDSAWARARAADPGAAYVKPFLDDARATVVAGSTWRPDEEVLLPALDAVRAHVPQLRLLIAPHEPTPHHLEQLEAALTEHGWSSRRLSRIERAGGAEGTDAIVVDRVGVLAHLYVVGNAAFVGGGFHRHGLHSVLEPAAHGLPVVFGPGHHNARSAADLILRGGAASVSTPQELATVLGTWLVDGEGVAAGERARAYVESHRGAAEKTAAALSELLGKS